MPGFFDMNWNDPETQRLLGGLAGLASGFSKAAMPSSLPIPDGAAFGMGAEGLYGGMRSGSSYASDSQTKRLDNSTKAVDLDRALLIENLLRKSLGKPELSMDDLTKNAGQVRSPIFGIPQIGGPSTALAAQGAPVMASPAAAEAAAGQDAAAPGENDATGASSGFAQAVLQKMLFGSQPTEYAKAKMYADMLPEGPEKLEAQRAAAKAAGVTITMEARPGGVVTMWNPNKRNKDGSVGGMDIAFRNPHLPDGVTLDDSGGAMEIPNAMDLIRKVEATKSGVKLETAKKEKGFENYLATGGLGMGTATGELKQPTPTVAGDYAARVAQLESGGDPTATNGRSTATGQHQFLQGTWLDQAKRVLPADFLKGKSDEQILALRNDPQVSAAITTAYAAENAGHMQKAGVQNIGPAELYMAHHFGPDGATQLLKAPLNTPMEQIVSPEVLQANPQLAGMTVADVYSQANQAMRGIAKTNQQAPKAAPAKPGAVKSSIPPISEAAPIPQGEIYLKERIPQWAEQENHWAQSMPASTVAEQRALAIAEAMKHTQSGHWAEEKAKVAARLKAIGLDIGKESWFGDPAAVQTILKDNFAATLEQIKAFTSRPAAVEVTLASQNFANPNLQPEANLKIIAQAIGTMRWDRQMMQDWAEAKKLGWQDPQDFQRAWIKRNPVQGFIDGAAKEIGPLKGMDGAKPPPGKPDPAAQKLITKEAIEFTAKKYGKTVDEVKADMRARGYTVP